MDGYGAHWTLDPAVKPFGTTVKKAAKKEVEAEFFFVIRQCRINFYHVILCEICQLFLLMFVFAMIAYLNALSYI
jgi:hypothetical protein